MGATLTEAEIISAITGRHPNAAELLYDQYATPLFRIICCSMQNAEAAEAVLEKTMLAVWQNFKDFHLQDKRLLLWMAGIARNLASIEKGTAGNTPVVTPV